MTHPLTQRKPEYEQTNVFLVVTKVGTTSLKPTLNQNTNERGDRVSRLGLVVRLSAGKRKDAGSTPRFGSPFSSKNVILWTLSHDFALHNS